MNAKRVSAFAALAFVMSLSLCGALTHAQSSGQSPVADASVPDAPAAAPTPLYSFVVIGDDRSNNEKNDPASTANENQLNRSFAEIQALQPKPSYVFFNGDMVYGPTTKPVQRDLKSELDAWLNVYKASPLGKDLSIPLIPIPGNHELNLKAGHQTQPGAESLWLTEMDPYLRISSNGPLTGAPLCGGKKLVSDQKKLTYSFDSATLPGTRYDHFVVINTDPASPTTDADANSSTVPLDWIKADLEAARKSPNIWHIFAFGHKQAYLPSWMAKLAGEDPGLRCTTTTTDGCGGAEGNCSGLNFHPTMRDTLFKYFNTNKVAVYFTGHIHTWDEREPPANKATWQVVVGNGGAPMNRGSDKLWHPGGKGKYYGFTVVSVWPSGRVMIASYGRDFKRTDFEAPSPPAEYPTELRDCFCIDADGGPDKPANQACASSLGSTKNLPASSNATLSCKQ